MGLPEETGRIPYKKGEGEGWGNLSYDNFLFLAVKKGDKIQYGCQLFTVSLQIIWGLSLKGLHLDLSQICNKKHQDMKSKIQDRCALHKTLRNKRSEVNEQWESFPALL